MQNTELFTRASAFFARMGKARDGFLDGIKTSENFKYRVAGLATAAALGVFALAMGFSLLGAVFGIRAFNPFFGDFFSRSYGILAFFVPAFLGYAAYILLDPRWRPEKIFALNASLLPFLTLGIGFILMRDFDGLSSQNGFLDAVGRTGFGILAVLLTFLQVIGLQALKNALFPQVRAAGKVRVWRLRKQGPFLPPPKELPREDDGAAAGAAVGAAVSAAVGADCGKTESTETRGKASVIGEWDGAEPDDAGPETYSREEGEVETIELEFAPACPIGDFIAIEYIEESSQTKTLNEATVVVDGSLEADGGERCDERGGERLEKDLRLGADELSYLEADEPDGYANAVGAERAQKEAAAIAELLREAEAAAKLHAEQLAKASEILAGEKGAGEALGDMRQAEDLTGEAPDGWHQAEGLAGETPGDWQQAEDLADEALDDWRQAEGLAGEAPGGMQQAEGLAGEAPGSQPQAQAEKPGAGKKAKSPQGRQGRKGYSVPLEVLNQYPDGEYWIIDQATRDAARTLKETLEEFKIQAEVTGIRKGPVITMFEILPAPGVKLSRIVNLQDNIALRLAASSVRIVAPIPGKHAVGIEVPNAKRNIVSFREIIEGELQREGKRPEIPVVMGKDIGGEAQTIDLTQTPHLLIAGATGAGKSVCVNSMILSILYRLPPSDCRLILIDPKIVELKLYNDIPHLLTPVITEPKRAFQALQYCIFEMERRYACLDSLGVRDIRNYNKRIKERNIAQEKMPYIVIIIDEFADLMATTGKELESTVARLAAMSRAVGIHLVLATQRPSIDVITGLIKANIPSRIAFMVASKMDSRIIIDMVGAEKLLGKGDMLYAGVVDPFPTRMQGAFVSEDEVEAVVAHVKTLGEPDYIDDEIFFDDEEDGADPAFLSEGDDPLYEKAMEIVVQQGKASASYIQRRLKIGYNRAARLVEIMERQGVVGPAQGSRPRELLRGV